MLRSWRRELYFFSSVVTKLKLSVELFHVLGIPVCQLLITLNALFEFSIRLENWNTFWHLFSKNWKQRNLDLNIVRQLQLSSIMVRNKFIRCEVESALTRILTRAIDWGRQIIDMHLLLLMVKFPMQEPMSLLKLIFHIDQWDNKRSLHSFLGYHFASIVLCILLLLWLEKVYGEYEHSFQLLSQMAEFNYLWCIRFKVIFLEFWLLNSQGKMGTQVGDNQLNAEEFVWVWRFVW